MRDKQQIKHVKQILRYMYTYENVFKQRQYI